MIGTIRKHSKWLWALVIGATIASFVIYLDPSKRYTSGSSSSGSAPSDDMGSFYGEPISPQDYAIANREAKLFFRIRSGQWAETEAQRHDVDQATTNFMLVQAELRHYNIDVTPTAAARFTRQLFGAPPDAPIPQEKLDQALTDILRNGDCDANDFVRYVHLMAGQEYLLTLFGMSGALITDKEAESFYRRENEPIQTQLVSFAASNYLASIKPTDADLADFYAKRQAQYRIPEQIVLNYVAFENTNYAAAAEKELGTNIEAKVDQVYASQDPDAYRDENHKQLSPEEARAKIRTTIRISQARVLARKDASEFGSKLVEGHDDQHPYTPDDLATVAKKAGLTLRATAPFDLRDGCPELDLSPQQLHIVFSLTDNDPDDKSRSSLYYPSPLPTDKGSFVVGLKERIPSRIPPLADVHDRVVEDYRNAVALQMARDAGKRFAAAAASAPAGATFDQICGSQGVSPLSLPAFSVATPGLSEITNRNDFQQLQSAVYLLPAGKISPFVPTDDGGYVAAVKARLPVDEAAMAQSLPTYLARMRQQRQVAAFQDWMNEEAHLHFVPPRNKPSSS